MNVQVQLTPPFPFKTVSKPGLKIYYTGSLEGIDILPDTLNDSSSVLDVLVNFIKRNKACFSLIVESDSFVFAAVDRVRSYPLYYSDSGADKVISSNVYAILGDQTQVTPNHSSLLSLAVSGYIFGKNTLYDSIKQMQAGEFLFADKNDSVLIVKSYYTYQKTITLNSDMVTLSALLSDQLDTAISDLIKYAHGRPIWLPLSGGLDSRLLACKLVEHGYPKLFTFSYGLSGNHEMKQAAAVAKKLNIPWYKVHSNSKRAYRLYHSQTRMEYERYAGGITHIPSYMEYEAIHQLLQRNLLPEDAVIVNGQTGDFLSGGHLADFLFMEDSTFDDMLDYIILKQCHYWPHLLTEENKNRIKSLLRCDLESSGSLLDEYEQWEWKERQAKFVMRGQRLYEYMNRDWYLPFWHADLMNFWLKVPYELKRNQKLYIHYLKTYNYKNTFDILRRTVNPWVMKYRWIPLLAKSFRVLCGENTKRKFYKHMRYYSTYHDQYALFGKKYYRSHYKKAHDPASFMIKDFIKNFTQTDLDDLFLKCAD